MIESFGNLGPVQAVAFAALVIGVVACIVWLLVNL